jgi:FkbM family methyltransferase
MSTGPKNFVKKAEQTLDFVLFDIGCGNGSRAYQWALTDKNAHVFCFDPLKSCITQAVTKSKDKYVIGRMHPFQAAVSMSGLGMTAAFYCSNDISSCSLLPFNNDTITRWKYPPGKTYFKTVETVQVPIIRMDKFMADRRISRVLFVRIETQGTALDVVKSFGKLIKNVMEFAIKVHTIDFEIYQGQTKKQDLVNYMNSNGFSIYGVNSYSRDQEEIIYFVNRTMNKNNLHLDY